MGEAKGHTFLGEPVVVDATTLQQVALAGNAFADGLPVLFDHGSGIADLVGSIRNLSIVADHVQGDLSLLKKRDSYEAILELAETMPNDFGLSISFLNAPEPVMGSEGADIGDEHDGDEEPVTGSDIVAYAARIEELYSCDLVQSPACNSSLFQTMPNPRNGHPRSSGPHRGCPGDHP
jgi:hypothetical protein